MIGDQQPAVKPCLGRRSRARMGSPSLHYSIYDLSFSSFAITLLLPILASLPYVSAQAKAPPLPISIPFSLFSNGQGRFGSWYGIPLSIGSQKVNLTISTASTFSWVVSSDIEKKFCGGLPELPQDVLAKNGIEGNRTVCRHTLGGSYDSSKDKDFKKGDDGVTMIDKGNGAIYNFQGSSAFRNSGGTLLDVDGQGFLGHTTLSIPKFDLTGENVVDNAFVLSDQLFGVTTGYVDEGRGPRDVLATGQLSLQQLVLSLFSKGFIASPTAYFQQNLASESLRGSSYYIGSPYYTLVLGGWDSYRIDLNKTIEIPLIQVQQGTTPLPQAPKPQDYPAYRMELTINELTWGYTGAAERSILNEVGPSEIKCLIDSTTPYIWLPQDQVSLISELAALKQDKENNTMNHPTSNIPDSAARGHLVFGFKEMKGEKIRFENDPSFKIPYLTETESQPDFWSPHLTLPFRALSGSSSSKRDASAPRPDYSCVLGRAFLQENALFVNYHDGWFGLAPGGNRLAVLLKNNKKTAGGPIGLSRWDVNNPPSITNSTVILDPSSKPSKVPTSGSSTNGSGSTPPPGSNQKNIRLIACIVAGVSAILLFAGIFIFFCLRKRISKNKTDKKEEQVPIIEQPGQTGQGGQGIPVELHNISSATNKPQPPLPHPGTAELPPSHIPGPPPAYQYSANGSYGYYPPPPGPPPTSPVPPQPGQYWKPEGNQTMHEMPGNNGWNIQGQVYYEMGDRGMPKHV